ncbi:hypothetical protein [Natronolimnohabitans innermongolicus]|uniref:Nucleic acid-binding protein n=1 Tax=Natronolimnohabitans innermongolicus JCM 12255 TaxID=1227499 RepID=L9XDN6_9EURY|nr:hypothetical protein [Natronolimnohabitans innermongolicus]ELY58743.1 hypothetical protein C493_06232 [Natronolimnohabitans innermongolicus JCM 12255]
MPTAVVTDTGPIIHLAEADALSLLSVFDEIHIPDAVLGELEAGTVPTGVDDLDAEIREVTSTEDPYPDLDPGETAALRLAERTETILLTDDLDARTVAADRGVEVHGSIGVVLYAYSNDRLDSDDAKTLLQALHRDTTLYLAKPLLNHAIRLVEQDESGW